MNLAKNDSFLLTWKSKDGKEHKQEYKNLSTAYIESHYLYYTCWGGSSICISNSEGNIVYRLD